MSASASSLFPAISILAIALAGTAIVIGFQPDASAPHETRSAVAPEITDLEESIRALQAEIVTLNMRLDGLELERSQETARAESASPIEARLAAVPPLDDQITRAVESVIEERGAELIKKAQREAKRNGERDGMTKWVQSQQDRLPALFESITGRMDLDPRRERQVTDIMDATFATMAELTGELYSEPPPSPEESRVIMGEIKGSVGGMITQLDEILDDDEMIQLGQLTVDSEMPRVGIPIIEEGKDEDDE